MSRSEAESVAAALIASVECNDDACRKAGKEAREWSTQQTRAKAGTTSDVLNDLIEEVATLKAGGRKLYAVGD